MKNKSLTAVVATSLVLGMAVVPAHAQTAPFPTDVKPFQTIEKAKELPSEDEQDAYSFIIDWDEATSPATDEEKQAIADAIFADFNTTVEFDRISIAGNWILKLDKPVPAADVPELTKQLNAREEIAEAYIDAYQFPAAAPNDPEFDKQWPFHNEHDANVVEAWDLGFTGEGEYIGIVDSGITKHPDLDDKVAGGFDMIRNDVNSGDNQPGRDNDPSDPGDYGCQGNSADDSSWHGTHVAGIAAALTNNNEGVAGTAKDASIVPVRTMGKCGGTASDIADGIAWAVGEKVGDLPINPHPAKVVNMSISGKRTECSAEYQNAIAIARKHNAIIVAAAGNYDEDTAGYQPSNCDGVVVVGATGPEGHRASYSNYGEEITIGAPGGNTDAYEEGLTGSYVIPKPENSFYSTINLGTKDPGRAGYGYQEGTSMASPLVAGVVTMMKQANPSLTVEQVSKILQDTAQPYTEEPYVGGHYRPYKTANQMGPGIIDAFEAVCSAADLAGKAPEQCGEPDVVETTEPTSPTEPTSAEPTEAPVEPTTTTVTTTVTPKPVTKTTTSTVTSATTVTEPAEEITITATTTTTAADVTVTEKQAPTTETKIVSEEPSTVTETTVEEATTVKETVAPSTINETEVETSTAPGSIVTETTTVSEEPETISVTATETEVKPIDDNGEPVTKVETTTETTTKQIPTTVITQPAPVTETVKPTPGKPGKPVHTGTSSFGFFPLFFLLPLGIFSFLTLPGVRNAFDQLFKMFRF